ncbi:hypothetical protein QE152_g7908 [Popillia japonica]|uniref:Uncharacterized protein n=1 Tax=Popillia japonica TaxID=7064 RepID=A0AAW1M7I5_POPJA
MLSTCHLGTETVVIKSKRQTQTTKPKCIADYDTGKSPVDVSDQLASYNTALSSKLMIKIIWGTALVNAYFLCSLNTVNSNGIAISAFRQSVVSSPLEGVMTSVSEASSSKKPASVVHHLVAHETNKREQDVCPVIKCMAKKGKLSKEKGLFLHK